MELRTTLAIFLLSVIVLGGCKKKQDEPEPEPETPAIVVDTPFVRCAQLPPAPIPFGWTDTLTYGVDKSLNAFFVNPGNPNEIIYIADGDLFGYNKVFTYVVPTKQTTYLGNADTYLPQINNKNWLVFGKSDYDIYKIKTNGDSLTQLTFDHINHDPKWDINGKNIQFFRTAQANFESCLAEMDASGRVLNTFPLELGNTALARKNPNRIAYLKTNNTQVSVFYKDRTINSETLIITSLGSPTTYESMFSDLTFDNSDENLFWSNSAGIMRCNIATKKIDTLFKNCPNVTYANPVAAHHTDVLTVSCHIKRALGITRMYHDYRALELDLHTRQLREIKLFP